MKAHRHSIKEGRCGRRSFLSIGTERVRGDLLDARFELYWLNGSRSTGFAVRTNNDTAGWSVSACLHWVASAYLTVGSPALSSWRYRRTHKLRSERNVVSVAVHNRAVWWEVWHPLHEWHSGTPRWRSGSFQAWDWLVGKATYTTGVLHEADSTVSMPEGDYPCHVKIERAVWSRPRWRAQVVVRYSVDLEGGYVPVPGKGENSYDCGPDGLFGSSGPLPERFAGDGWQRHDSTLGADAVAEAVAIVRDSALATRLRRGVAADYADAIA